FPCRRNPGPSAPASRGMLPLSDQQNPASPCALGARLPRRWVCGDPTAGDEHSVTPALVLLRTRLIEFGPVTYIAKVRRRAALAVASGLLLAACSHGAQGTSSQSPSSAPSTS